MDITNCTKEELAQAVLELTVELGKTRRALNAALEVKSMKMPKVLTDQEYSEMCVALTKKAFPTLDPMAIDPRSVV
jgi:hypothetical protein